MHKWVFSCYLKLSVDFSDRMLAGRLFHAVGPATEKALDPSRDLVLGTSKCPSVADRR